MTDVVSTRGFQEPRFVASPQGCYFYHSIELPEFGLQVGQWDLRDDLDAYLGHQSFENKRVVDVGTASGYISFELEKRGAYVIAFDRDLTDVTDDMGLVPFADWKAQFGVTIEDSIREKIVSQRRLQDSFWLGHRLFGSHVRLYCGNVYEGLDPSVGSVDVSFFGCILLHLRDPLLAVTRFARLTRETLIITDTFENVGTFADYPAMFFRPNLSDHSNPGTWWWATPKLYRTFLEILGFKKFELTRHTTSHVESKARAEMFTLVAKR
jgi:hypothetical protein